MDAGGPGDLAGLEAYVASLVEYAQGAFRDDKARVSAETETYLRDVTLAVAEGIAAAAAQLEGCVAESALCLRELDAHCVLLERRCDAVREAARPATLRLLRKDAAPPEAFPPVRSRTVDRPRSLCNGLTRRKIDFAATRLPPALGFDLEDPMPTSRAQEDFPVPLAPTRAAGDDETAPYGSEDSGATDDDGDDDCDDDDDDDHRQEDGGDSSPSEGSLSFDWHTAGASSDGLADNDLGDDGDDDEAIT